jgi:serine/threonine protein kinase
MSPGQYQRAKSIFLLACDLAEDDRAARIAELAAGDEAVRQQAMAMLENDKPEELIATGAQLREGLEAILQAAATDEDGDGANFGVGHARPEAIGPYRIVRQIGSGGMGDVYEAQQETPRRRVAIKTMRAGLAGEAMLRRFRREIEFLGRLSHPGIAQVYEAGVTPIGGVRTPYYVMEFVDGLPLTEFARQRELDLKAKLRLFTAICDIVHSAHQQGVIHRDLKPANILVQVQAGTRGAAGPARSDATTTGWGAGDALPRILDFGIARAVSVDETEDGTGTKAGGAGRTMMTEVGQIIGTVAYMSPEQMAGRPDAIDTRTDVYALGVILFELLTGKLPHATEGLTPLEAAALKQNTPPMRLSTADPALRGDLETIVGKALDTDKKRRYPSASELGQDVRRFLNDEVVLARPASAMYQIRKFAQRNRGVTIAAAAAALCLIGGALATTLQARSAIAQRDVAVRKTEVAEAVSNVLLEALTVATPNGAMGKEPRLIDAIERIERQALAKDSGLREEVQAVVLNVIGIVHRERGEYERAEVVLTAALNIRRRVLDPGDPNLADSLNNMGLLRRKQERFVEAAAFMQEAVDLQRQSSFQDESRLARNIYNLGSAYISSGELAKAGPLLDESEAIHKRKVGGPSEIFGILFSARSRLAAAQGKLDAAADFAAKATATFRETVGPRHPSIATSLRDEGLLASRRGDVPGAVQKLIEADSMAHKVFTIEPPHPMLRTIRADLVKLLREAGRGDEAERLEKDLAALVPAVPVAPGGGDGSQ